MNKPKVNEKQIINLSLAVDEEWGGVRKCLVDQKINDNLYRVIPYSYGFGFESAESELMHEHARTIDISRFRRRCI